MSNPLLTILSCLLTWAAAYLALEIGGLSGRRIPWSLVAGALLLAGLGRFAALLGLLPPDAALLPQGSAGRGLDLLLSLALLAGLILVRRDLTVRRAPDPELRAGLEKAEPPARLQSEFFSRMSHELRTPLNAIIGFTDILLSGMDGPLNADQHKDAQMVFDGAQRLLRLIDNLLDLARIQAGRLQLSPEKVLLSQAVGRVLSEFRDRIRNQGLELTQKIPPDLPALRADPAQLHRILANLLANAAAFTHSGAIAVEAEPATRTGEPCAAGAGTRAGFVRITVADTGRGIPEQEIAAALEGGRRSDQGRQATSLGLPIARGLVELHGGVLGLRSQAGRGTRAWFTLPLWTDPPGPAAEPASPH